MPILALTSISGSPGVTTTALAWAFTSARPTLVVEADPTGGSAALAGVWGGAQPHDRSVLDLANYRSDEFTERLWQSTIELPGAKQSWLLPAIGTGAQSLAMMPVWPGLASTLREIADTGVDVLVDTGRITLANSPWPLVDAADAVLVLARANLQSLNALAIALPDLRDSLTATGTAQRLAVVPVVGGSKVLSFSPSLLNDFGAFPYRHHEFREISAPTAVLSPVQYDERAAAVYSNALPARRGERMTSYWRSIRHLIDAASEHAHKTHAMVNLEGHTA